VVRRGTAAALPTQVELATLFEQIGVMLIDNPRRL
jgi:hypothetical protein